MILVRNMSLLIQITQYALLILDTGISKTMTSEAGHFIRSCKNLLCFTLAGYLCQSQVPNSSSLGYDVWRLANSY